MARPTYYTAMTTIRKMALEGCTKRAICGSVGISRPTLDAWLARAAHGDGGELPVKFTGGVRVGRRAKPKQAAPDAALKQAAPASQVSRQPNPLQERVNRVLAEKREQILERAERIEDPVAAYAALSALRDNAADTAAWARAASLLPSEDSADLAAQIHEFGQAATAYMRSRSGAFPPSVRSR